MLSTESWNVGGFKHDFHVCSTGSHDRKRAVSLSHVLELECESKAAQ